MRRFAAPLVATLGAAALACATRAQAQGPATVSEVIVTARKQAEPALAVPVVETVVPGSRLDRLQVYSLKDLATLVPGLVIGDGRSAYGAQVSLRGVSATVQDPAVDQVVGLVIDGLELSQGVAYASGLFDVGQVEVLKGPQALFYGKSSIGGVISVRSADPGDKAEVVALTGHEFEADQWRSQVIVSGPVTDTLKLRLASLYATQEGYFRNPATGLAPTGARDPASRRLFPSTIYQIRGTALWAPSQRFDARLKLNLAHDRTLYAGAEQYVLCPDGTGAPFGIPFLGGGEDCKLDRTHRLVDLDPAFFPAMEGDGTPFFETTQAYGSLGLTYRIRPDLTLTSTTGYYNLHNQGVINLFDTTFAAPLIGANGHFKNLQVSQELRLSSDFSSRVNFTLGGYYETGSLGNLIGFFGNTGLGLPAILAKGSHDLGLRTYSVFGQVRWTIVPRVELGVGARWEDDKRSDAAVDFMTGTPVAVPLAVSSVRSSKVSPELTLTWRPSEAVTVFGALKRAYKPGSFNVVFPATPNEDDSYGDEKVEGGEVGLKSRLLDQRLALNLSGYDYHYSDLQVPVMVAAANGAPFPRLVNAGAARVYGVEVDAVFRPAGVEGLGLRASGAWTHARFRSFDDAPCYLGQTIAAGCDRVLDPKTGLFTAQDLSGTPTIRAPDWQVNFGFDYETGIGHDLTVAVSSNSHYSSSYRAVLGFPYDQPAYLKTDFSLALRGPRDRWEFAFVGRNLGGKLTAGSCSVVNAQIEIGPGDVTGGTGPGPAGVNEIACFVDSGREVWLRLTLRPLS